jgi:hypothetical protein
MEQLRAKLIAREITRVSNYLFRPGRALPAGDWKAID